ncbi:hypothetical protein [Shewanella sp.]|uniref:hypothetical protein n=1 Tax=Shewanella sp. TaxID=50422 RepID=UPI004053D9C7
MDKRDVLDIYREQFAFEMDRKKDITAQAQVRFALIATGVTLIIYMARNIDLTIDCTLLLIFAVLSVISITLFAFAALKLAHAFWNNEYTYLPPMDKSEKYRKELEASGQNETVFLEEYFLEEYSICAGENRETNNQRQQKMSSIVSYLKAATIPLVIVGGMFVLLDLDASSSRKVTDVNVIELQKVTYKQVEAPEATK